MNQQLHATFRPRPPRLSKMVAPKQNFSQMLAESFSPKKLRPSEITGRKSRQPTSRKSPKEKLIVQPKREVTFYTRKNDKLNQSLQEKKQVPDFQELDSRRLQIYRRSFDGCEWQNISEKQKRFNARLPINYVQQQLLDQKLTVRRRRGIMGKMQTIVQKKVSILGALGFWKRKSTNSLDAGSSQYIQVHIFNSKRMSHCPTDYLLQDPHLLSQSRQSHKPLSKRPSMLPSAKSSAQYLQLPHLDNGIHEPEEQMSISSTGSIKQLTYQKLPIPLLVPSPTTRSKILKSPITIKFHQNKSRIIQKILNTQHNSLNLSPKIIKPLSHRYSIASDKWKYPTFHIQDSSKKFLTDIPNRLTQTDMAESKFTDKSIQKKKGTQTCHHLRVYTKIKQDMLLLKKISANQISRRADSQRMSPLRQSPSRAKF